MSAEPAEPSYSEKSYNFLFEAKYELSTGASVHASEKLWGAAAQMVKGVAARRDWPHRSHRDLYQVIARLVGETGDKEFSSLFHIASDLHQNFYEQLQPIELIESAVPDIERLLQKLEPLA